jgi:hypothetical protein
VEKNKKQRTIFYRNEVLSGRKQVQGKAIFTEAGYKATKARL